jgi:hypothetical protein
VTPDEFEESGSILYARATRDLQALDDGVQVYWPHHDGRLDSMTFGIRFHARPASADN